LYAKNIDFRDVIQAIKKLKKAYDINIKEE